MRSEISSTNYSHVFISYEVFLYFFPNQFFQKIAFLCVLTGENKETFSERCAFINSVLEGLVKICKKNMEAAVSSS